MKSGTLFLLSGPSAVGKTTLTQHIIEELRGQLLLERLVTYTTKEPRPNEAPGKDYHFLDIESFQRLKQEDFFIESAYVYGNWYGIARTLLDNLAAGISYIAVVDSNGAQTLASLYKKHVGIWIDAPSIDELAKRMRARASDTPYNMLQRLDRAALEQQEARNNKVYRYYITNNDITATAAELAGIVRAEIMQEKS